MSDPFPEPKIKRPKSMRGNIARVFLNIEPRANMEEPITHKKENKNRPTEKKKKTKQFTIN